MSTIRRRRRRARAMETAAPLEAPASAYEMVTRRAVDDLEREIGRIDVKINTLMVGVTLTFGVEVWKAFVR